MEGWVDVQATETNRKYMLGFRQACESWPANRPDMFYTGDDDANKGKAYLRHWCTGSHFSRRAWWLGTPYNNLVPAPRFDRLLTGATGSVTGSRSSIGGGDTSKIFRLCTHHVQTTSISSNWCQMSSFTWQLIHSTSASWAINRIHTDYLHCNDNNAAFKPTFKPSKCNAM